MEQKIHHMEFLQPPELPVLLCLRNMLKLRLELRKLICHPW